MEEPNRASGLVADLSLTSKEFFEEAVKEALECRKVKTHPRVSNYLVELLQYYMVVENLFDHQDEAGRKSRETLAGLFLKASNSEPKVRVRLLKKLGDTSLYISGFFGDSLQRKIVDVDYYADMGVSAYASLADFVREEALARVFKEFSMRFMEFVDVLTHISTKTMGQQAEQNILRLFDVYMSTGSELAKAKLLEKGLIAVNADSINKKKQ